MYNSIICTKHKHSEGKITQYNCGSCYKLVAFSTSLRDVLHYISRPTSSCMLHTWHLHAYVKIFQVHYLVLPFVPRTIFKCSLHRARLTLNQPFIVQRTHNLNGDFRTLHARCVIEVKNVNIATNAVFPNQISENFYLIAWNFLK